MKGVIMSHLIDQEVDDPEEHLQEGIVQLQRHLVLCPKALHSFRMHAFIYFERLLMHIMLEPHARSPKPMCDPSTRNSVTSFRRPFLTVVLAAVNSSATCTKTCMQCPRLLATLLVLF